MSTQQDDRVLVVVQMTGGNDFLNTVVPFTNEHYFDARKKIRINPDEVLPINDELGINQNAAPFKRLYDEGKMAIVQRRRLSQLQPVSLPRYGHLAHL